MTGKRTFKWIIGTFLVLSAFALLQSTPVVADETVPGEVLVVLAAEKAGEVDAELANISALKKPPFSAFKSMKVLTRTDIKLKPDQPFEVSLPNGRHLRLTLTERLVDGRSKVQLSINKPNQKDYLPLLEVKARAGEPFFVAGQSYEGGTLVIGVRVGAKKPVEPAAAKKK
jgi:hypothetical protein